MGTRDVPLKFREPSICREGDPLHIFGTGKARNVKFNTINVGHVRH